VVLLDKRPQQPGLQRGLLFFKQSERPSCLPMAALEESLGPGQTLPQTLISRRGALAGSARAVEVPLGGQPPSPPPWRWPTEAIGSRDGQAVFNRESGGWTCVDHPDHPEAKGLTSRSSAGFRRSWSWPASPGGLPLCPRISLLVLGGFPAGQLAVHAGLLGRPAGLKPPTRERGWPGLCAGSGR